MDSSQIIHLIQKNIPYGTNVVFYGLNEAKIGSGKFVGFNRDVVLLENNGEERQLPLGLIISWAIVSREVTHRPAPVKMTPVKLLEAESLDTTVISGEELEMEADTEVEVEAKVENAASDSKLPITKNISTEQATEDSTISISEDINVAEVKALAEAERDGDSSPLLESNTAIDPVPEINVIPDAASVTESVGEGEQIIEETSEVDFKVDNTPDATELIPESTAPVELPIALQKIKYQFELRAENIQLNSSLPIFELTEEEAEMIKGTKGAIEWEGIKDSLDYAHRVKEVDDKYGRIDSNIRKLKHLSGRYVEVSGFYRFLGSLYQLKSQPEEAYLVYRNAALVRSNAMDWLNYGVEALKAGNNKAACHGIGEYLQNSKPPFNEKLWSRFALLANEFHYYDPLQNVIAHYAEAEEHSPDISREYFETGLYLMILAGREQLAVHHLERYETASEIDHAFLQELFSVFTEEPAKELTTYIGSLKKPENNIQLTQLIDALELEDNEGFIYSYKGDRNFGFIRTEEEENFFFHRSSVIDDELLLRLKQTRGSERLELPVEFEPTQGPKGPVAIRVSLRRSQEDLMTLAYRYADKGDYAKAISQLNQLLIKAPNNESAKQKLEVWREYAKVSGMPKGNNPYAQAKRAHVLEKDLEKASYLLKQAIEEDDHTASAIMDLASLYNQMEAPEKAIATLKENRHHVKNQKSVDHQLIVFYQRASKFEEAIRLLRKKLEDLSQDWKRAQAIWEIGNVYLRIPDYEQAELQFNKVLRLQPDNRAAKRNIALCLFKLGEIDKAERMLNDILDDAADQQAANILTVIEKARSGDSVIEMEEIIIASALSDFSRETSGFTEFILEHCKYQGVPPDRVQSKIFNHRDIKNLEKLANELGARRPEERAGYFLSAAKIHSMLDNEDPRKFYKYLCRSFASQGDAVVHTQGRSLDIAREFYCEALQMYDGARVGSKDEPDANLALIRFLFASFDQRRMIPIRTRPSSVGDSLVQILNKYPEPNHVFNWISYLIYRSRFAAERILKPIFNKSTLQAMATDYLKSRNITVPEQIRDLKEFAGLWKILQRKMSEKERAFSNEFQQLKKLELTTVSLDNSIHILDRLYQQLLLDLDQQRVLELQRLLKMTLEMRQQSAFEDVERLCNQVIESFEVLQEEISKGPTRISVEEIFPVIEYMKSTVIDRREELYTGSLPEITLGQPVPPPAPDENKRITLQISLKNKMGASPAEGIELIVQEEEEVFSLVEPEIKSPASLRGGEQRIINVQLQLHEKAITEQAFSLPVYAQYRTRSGEVAHTDESKALPVQLPGEFSEIDNPYERYAEGGIVGDDSMFYGRDELIKNVSASIKAAKKESKSVVIYGQKRAGKSSILYHLKKNLEKDDDLLILDLGNFGKIYDKNSKFPLEYVFLRNILLNLEFAVDDKVEEGKPEIKFECPSEEAFFNAASPLNKFSEILERFLRKTKRTKGWKKVRLVLFIDEFNYVYTYFLKNEIPESFMKTWKALLEKGYYSAVLAGQDVMPKFKERFSNEFGTTQDERVTYLKQEDAILLIDKPIRIERQNGDTDSRYREQAINYILDLTAGSPFYIQIICNRLVNYMNRKQMSLVTQADVEQVKEDLIKGTNSLSRDKFENLFNSGDTAADAISDEDVLKLMTVIAKNSKTSQGQCSRQNIVCETTTDIDVILDDLVKRDVLERSSGQYYSIRLGLFKEWLLVHPY